MWGISGIRASSLRVASACLGIAFTLALVPVSTAQQRPPLPPRPEAEYQREATRDSLRAEIARYAKLIAELKSSVDSMDVSADPRDDSYVQIEASAAAISEAIGAVAAQLAELELQVDEGQISLSDGHGGRVTLDIPEDFGEQISRGIGDIAKAILDEMPDTLRIGEIGRDLTFNTRTGRASVIPVAPPPPPRKVIEGGIVKIRDDLEIPGDELILGDVVAVLSDVQIDGQVQGDLIVVFGDVTLSETAEIDGEVVTVFGRFERADGARVGSITVVNPGDAYLPSTLSSGAGGWVGFWGGQAFFLLLVFLVLLMVTLSPRVRLDRVVVTLQTRAAESLGVGLLMALVGHLVLLGLGAILVFTVIGIPVAILLLLAVALVDLIAVGVASLVVGRLLCARAGMRCGVPWREVLLGMLLLHLPAFVATLAGAVGLPIVFVVLLAWVGRTIKFVAFCFGLGALVLGRFGNAGAPALPPPVLDPLPETSGH